MNDLAYDAEAADLAGLALAAVGALLPLADASAWSAAMLPACVAALRRSPGAADRSLVRVAAALGLDDDELMAVALCLAVERDPRAARAVAEAQAPLGGSRPLVGFTALALAPLGATTVTIGCGSALAAGLLTLGDEPAALPERSLALPLPILAALSGQPRAWAGVEPLAPKRLGLTAAVRDEVAARARMLAAAGSAGVVLRSASSAEAVAVAGELAEALGSRLVRVDGEPPHGFAPWLVACAHLPLFAPRLGPGERWALPRLAPYRGPWIVACGIDGAIEAETPPDEWILPIPEEEEREGLWSAAGILPEAARRAANSFRQGAGRIAEVAGRASHVAARRGLAQPGWDEVTTAISRDAGTLDMLARRSPNTVDDAALILPAELRDGLERLLERARVRSRLAQGLGPAAAARYRPGVRALLVGGSGTGKTLAAHWLATRLGLPLYRIDLAALTSKWIGETEKNLSAVLSAAEHADVLLFFDEADALFGARTDVGDAHDRYANAQTNYLLQRIEEFDGIAIIASNSRDRFDPAFSRRLDAILEFPMPDPPARRDLWLAHLGGGHALSEPELDRLAVTVDLAGGHIRNIVLAAAARGVVSAGRSPGTTSSSACATNTASLAGRRRPCRDEKRNSARLRRGGARPWPAIAHRAARCSRCRSSRCIPPDRRGRSVPRRSRAPLRS